jgi:hypothetical protein
MVDVVMSSALLSRSKHIPVFDGKVKRDTRMHEWAIHECAMISVVEDAEVCAHQPRLYATHPRPFMTEPNAGTFGVVVIPSAAFQV